MAKREATATDREHGWRKSCGFFRLRFVVARVLREPRRAGASEAGRAKSKHRCRYRLPSLQINSLSLLIIVVG